MPCQLREKNQSVQRLSVNISTRWLLDSDIQILLNIGQGNGLLPDDTKSLNQCLLINGEVMSCSPEGNITEPGNHGNAKDISHYR